VPRKLASSTRITPPAPADLLLLLVFGRKLAMVHRPGLNPASLFNSSLAPVVLRHGHHRHAAFRRMASRSSASSVVLPVPARPRINHPPCPADPQPRAAMLPSVRHSDFPRVTGRLESPSGRKRPRPLCGQKGNKLRPLPPASPWRSRQSRALPCSPADERPLGPVSRLKPQSTNPPNRCRVSRLRSVAFGSGTTGLAHKAMLPGHDRRRPFSPPISRAKGGFPAGRFPRQIAVCFPWPVSRPYPLLL